tara:strand:- start:247 stop:816 length:570 start_codon:yes stop_codon:yes gene_type:complete
MIRIGILGDIGSGKSYISKCFGYPVFNADKQVSKLYKKNRRIFLKLKKILPKHFKSFPINKKEVSNAILAKNNNLKKIVHVVHSEVRKEMNIFLKKNKKRKIVILDIPLLLENKLNKKNDILIFVQASKTKITKRLRKRLNYNNKILEIFKNIQLPLHYKRKKSKFVIKNNFSDKSVKKEVKKVLNKIL